MRRLLTLIAFVILAATVRAQDPVTVDPKHYKVEVDNAQVRVLRIHYGPHEKSVMHDHPASVAVFLTDGHFRFTMPDGTTREQTEKTGEVQFSPAGKHLPENLSDKPFELILVELKAKPAEKKAPGKAPAKKPTS